MSGRGAAIPRYRPAGGPAVLGAGFRPFFLLAGLWAALAVPLWLAVLTGRVVLPTAFDPLTWHGHEMLFGFAQAAIAGFLLTAVPNWTGRMPIQGPPLGALALLFVAGRIAVAWSAAIGPGAAAIIDLAFPLVLLAALAREICAGRNWRNLPMLGALGLISAANGLTHLEALGWAGTAPLGLRLGTAIIIVLIGLVGGRIIPSFTRNWLAKRSAPRLPASFGRFDRAAVAATVTALAVWAFAPDWPGVPPLVALAAVMNALRLARWQGHRTLAEPLVTVLHLGFLWIPVGLALMALAPFAAALSPSAALHALTGGAIATMILAVSTRATLGHTGRALHAERRTTAIYGLVTVAAAAR
ncbi:MAG TPA: NnrS family protein, partial [Kiloniellales bacterium]|nr:NnrS family protein [Kiloniellales bacterium]